MTFRARSSGRLASVACICCSLVWAGATYANVVVDFRQSSNNETNGSIQGLGNIHWINSIVQSSNSSYFEGMDNLQRTILTTIPATTGNVHTLSISHQFTKSGIHAYDFLVSWAQAEVDDEESLGLPGPPIVMSMNPCGDEIGPPGNLATTCSSLRSGGNFLDVVVPDDPYVSKDGSTALRIAAYEALRGNRTIRIYGNAAISSGSLLVCHDVATGGDTGDSFAHYVLTWTSTSTQILVEIAGHLAISGDGTGMSWRVGLGSSQISGGPYHFKLGQMGGGGKQRGGVSQHSERGRFAGFAGQPDQGGGHQGPLPDLRGQWAAGSSLPPLLGTELLGDDQWDVLGPVHDYVVLEQ